MVSDALEDAAGINKKSSKMFKKLDRLCLFEKIQLPCINANFDKNILIFAV